jgi:pyrimidine deaminase RibD-like protein
MSALPSGWHSNAAPSTLNELAKWLNERRDWYIRHFENLQRGDTSALAKDTAFALELCTALELSCEIEPWPSYGYDPVAAGRVSETDAGRELGRYLGLQLWLFAAVTIQAAHRWLNHNGVSGQPAMPDWIDASRISGDRIPDPEPALSQLVAFAQAEADGGRGEREADEEWGAGEGQNERYVDRKFMERAVEEARKSKAEDERVHPKVGVVIVKDGRELATAYRGELGDGEHAEYTALEKKLTDETIAGATVYTTLEPCTTRNHPKVPCADRLIERKVSRVVIGMLDPNSEISGKGVRKLREANTAVGLFPRDLMSKIEEMNREFTRHHVGHPAGVGPAVPAGPSRGAEQSRP